MRVLSPRIEPPLRVLDGSTASTATRWPCSTRCSPSASMKVDLPAPGAPVMPTRTAPPRAGSSSSSSASASARWSARVDSTSVIARASARRSPSTTWLRQLAHARPLSVPRTGPLGPRSSRGPRMPGSPPLPLMCARGYERRQARRRRLRISAAACGMLVPGTEDRGDAGLAELVVVLRGDHAADDHEDVVGRPACAAAR